MAKLMCAKCGGKVKMANGGTTPKKVLAKAPVNMYGIPQENMGTSSQYGFGRKGGAVKKMQNGGNVASEKPWKNLGIATAAGSLIGALTSEKGIARRADKADARYKKRQTKKLMKVAPKKKP